MNQVINDMSKVQIIRRADIPSIHSVVENGKAYNLGTVKNFRDNPQLNALIPSNTDLSMSWVNLPTGEILDMHTHPIKSIIIICQGRAIIIDEEQEIEVNEGDIIIIPESIAHGVKGGQDGGFWGLSIQFEQTGLYDDLENPLISFTS